MGSIVLFNVAGFILVSQAKDLFMALTGVVSMSLASGLGEASILAHMALYKNKSVFVLLKRNSQKSDVYGYSFFLISNFLLSRHLSYDLHSYWWLIQCTGTIFLFIYLFFGLCLLFCYIHCSSLCWITVMLYSNMKFILKNGYFLHIIIRFNSIVAWKIWVSECS